MSGKTPLPVWIAAVLVLGLVAGAGSATAQNGKFAVISTQEIIESSNAGKKAIEDLRALQQQKENEVKAKQQEITDLRDRLAEGRLSLAEDKLLEMQTALEGKAKELRRLQEDAAAELERRQQTALADIEKRVMPIINQVGREDGYTMIFRKFDSGLIYVDDAVDITQRVIDRLNQEMAGGSAGGSR